eukprot:768256-Hanusia_phi.AAC.2
MNPANLRREDVMNCLRTVLPVLRPVQQPPSRVVGHYDPEVSALTDDQPDEIGAGHEGSRGDQTFIQNIHLGGLKFHPQHSLGMTGCGGHACAGGLRVVRALTRGGMVGIQLIAIIII